MSIGLLRGFAVAVGGAYLAGRWLRRRLESGEPPPPQLEAEYDDELVQDSVCGVYLPSRQALVEIHGRERHYFCSAECRKAFLKARKERRA